MQVAMGFKCEAGKQLEFATGYRDAQRRDSKGTVTVTVLQLKLSLKSGEGQVPRGCSCQSAQARMGLSFSAESPAAPDSADHAFRHRHTAA
jgi:hypothetical protein